MVLTFIYISICIYLAKNEFLWLPPILTAVYNKHKGKYKIHFLNL